MRRRFACLSVIPLAGFLLSGSPPILGPKYTIVEIGTLGGSDSNALAIIENAQVVGSAFNAQGFRRAYLWEEGAMIDLGVIPGTTTSEAWGINNLGVVAVNSSPTGFGKVFLWENDVKTEITTPLGSKSIFDIKGAGQIVGQYGNTMGESHACLWEPDGTFIDLGTLGGTYSIAWEINENAVVPGSSFSPLGERAFHWAGGTMTDIGTLGGTHSEGYCINDSGHIVGRAQPEGTKNYNAFLWQSGQMTNVGALGDSAAGAVASRLTTTESRWASEAGPVFGTTRITGWWTY